MMAESVKISAAKLAFDIIFSSLSLLLLSPFILAIVLAMLAEGLISRSARGSVLYSETRISQGIPFRLYKFRIFKERALAGAINGNGVVHTKELEKDKKNMTAVGAVLKQVYMDELPQLFNVLRGDMSIVGPRSTNLENYERWCAEGKFSKKLIRAGITGYFQSHKGRKMQFDQDQTDMIYVNFCRNNPGWKVVLYDLKILFITLLTIIRAEGI